MCGGGEFGAVQQPPGRFRRAQEVLTELGTRSETALRKHLDGVGSAGA
ncbi:hypothetical protein [Streptomyces flaveus]